SHRALSEHKTLSISWSHYRFFHSLKVECLHGEHFISREIMRATVFNYIECDYNRWRRHSWCGGLSPEQFENQNLA
ncbi:IS3 family transposase, partial [Escherichia coli]|uniref:IS3 family transposase n=1 Tax=Escherichia coli TaxID=562 RepID=UPI00112247F3